MSQKVLRAGLMHCFLFFFMSFVDKLEEYRLSPALSSKRYPFLVSVNPCTYLSLVLQIHTTHYLLTYTLLTDSDP